MKNTFSSWKFPFHATLPNPNLISGQNLTEAGYQSIYCGRDVMKLIKHVLGVWDKYAVAFTSDGMIGNDRVCVCAENHGL